MPSRRVPDHDRIRKKRILAIREKAESDPMGMVNIPQFRVALIKTLHAHAGKPKIPGARLQPGAKEMFRETTRRAILASMRKYGIQGKKDRAEVVALTRLALQGYDHQMKIVKRHGREFDEYEKGLLARMYVAEELIQLNENKLKEYLGPLAHEYMRDVFRIRNALAKNIDKIINS